MTDYFSDSDLIKMPPVKRAAYFDRTAWLMLNVVTRAAIWELGPDHDTDFAANFGKAD
ncbi:MAG: hypothetical protein J7L57_03275 [Deltaproteobacteria bacterium]|nr:hypothetical protein [Candidatus Tharpella sp.]